MDVALEHFSQTGFHVTTISHIARHAGISKGLMYNYFKSKEELLAAILERSLSEIYSNFDTDRDGRLSNMEFESFIRKVFYVLRENRKFWKLIYRIMLQPGVYEDFLGTSDNSVKFSGLPLKQFSENIMSMLIDYFKRKKESSGTDYDPVIEMFMFMNTVKGFALTFIMAEELYQGDFYEKMLDEIIKRYK